MAAIQLGFVGVGGMGQSAHLINYASLMDCEVVALAELRPELGRKVAARYGIPGVYTDFREMLAKTKLDALVAIGPFGKHGGLIPELLASGLPLLTEKPLARSVEIGERILKAAKPGQLHIAYHKRSDLAMLFLKQKLKEWQTSGIYGKLSYIRITMPPGDWSGGGFSQLITSDEPYPATPDDPPSPGLSAEMTQKYDAFVNYYIHQVNLLRYLYGESYEVLHANPEAKVVVTRSESGVTGVLENGIYSTSLGWQETAFVAFERGWLKVELPEPLAAYRTGRVTIYEDAKDGRPPITWQPELPPVHAMKQQAIHYLASIRGKTTALCGPEDALEDLKIARTIVELQNLV